MKLFFIIQIYICGIIVFYVLTRLFEPSRSKEFDLFCSLLWPFMTPLLILIYCAEFLKFVGDLIVDEIKNFSRKDEMK